MKRKRSSAVLGCILALLMLAGITIPIANAASETITFLNPLGDIEPQYNQPLAERVWTDFNGKKVALCYYVKDANREAAAALGELLTDNFNDVITDEVSIADANGALAAAEYDALAEYDAVIMGVADEAVCAWWSIYHAKQIEARGTPVVVLANSTYETNIEYAAQDNGFTGVRLAVIDRKWYARAYANLETFADGVAYMKTKVMVGSNLDGNLPDRGSVYLQAIKALTEPLTAAETVPPEITSGSMGVPDWTTNSVTGVSYEKALLAFNSFAMANNFGDGLPLVPPTRELVDNMLAATDRGKDEVLGKMRMRGGIITVEKVAINSVMAGLEPKCFPVVIAAMEAYASSLETDKTFYHAMNTGSGYYTIMLILSGPLGKELGVAGDRGLGASGFNINNTIGRAFRLCTRNIGHTANTDESNRSGRENDHALYVFREQDELLPPGWKTHSEMMGYPEGSSSVTLHAYYVTQEWYGGDTFGYQTGGEAGGILGHLRNGMYKDGKDKDLAVVWILPGLAWDLYDTLGMQSKDAMRNRMMELGVNTAPGGATQYEGAASPYGLSNMPDARISDRLLIMPIVAGGDPGYTRVYTGSGYGTRGFQTQLITGATQTASGTGATAPSAPQDFNVKSVGDGTKAVLTWSAPLSDGGSSITKYQASCDDGITWIDVSGGADAESYMFTGLTPGMQYFFRVRAVNGVKNAAEIVDNDGVYIVSNRSSGLGAWACEMFSPQRVAPTSMRINGAALVTVRRNATTQLAVTVAPADADETVVWSSSNPAFVSVDEDGFARALAIGTAVITAKTPDGAIISTVTLRVTA